MLFDTLLQVVLFLPLIVFVMVGVVCRTLMGRRVLDYMGIKIFNNLPSYIKDASDNIKKFEHALKQFLYTHSFYSLGDYFQHNSDRLHNNATVN